MVKKSDPSKAPKEPQKVRRSSGSSAPIVDSLATALSLLDHFSRAEPELSLMQLSEKTGLYKSRIHRLCGTMVAMGFLVRTPWSSYKLGPKLMALGKIYESTNSIISISRPIMKTLAHATGESVALFQLDGEIAVCLAREFGPSRLVFSINEGDPMELYASAAGRVILAYGPQELRSRIIDNGQFESFTPFTLLDREKIKLELSSLKQRGYSVNRGERELEVAAVAAPIFDHEQKVDSALVVAGPAQRFADVHIPGIVEPLLKATRDISRLLGAAL